MQAIRDNLLISTVGLPRSGKTTWAKTTGHPIVCPDAIRLALHGERFLKTAEPMVWTIAACMVRASFLAGHEVVIFDATNTTRTRRDSLLKWSEISGKENLYRVRFKVIDTSCDECILRAKEDGDEEIIPVIRSMADKWEPLFQDELGF